jgi:hypothetical protein
MKNGKAGEYGISIIVGKTAIFEPQPSIEDSTRFVNHLVFITFNFAVIIFVYRARLSAMRPTPNLKDQTPVFMSLSDMVAQLYPQAPGSLFVTLYDSQGCGRGTLIRIHTGGTGNIKRVVS